ncbi:MAG: hypothetical protein QXS54_00745 [Candidatus Methanomethylicaceae archaeon]
MYLEIGLTAFITVLAIRHLWYLLSAIRHKEDTVAKVNGLQLMLWSVLALVAVWLLSEQLNVSNWYIWVPPAFIAFLAPVLVYLSIEDDSQRQEAKAEDEVLNGNNEHLENEDRVVR